MSILDNLNHGTFYDRRGNTMSLDRFLLLKFGGLGEDIVARTQHGEISISTVWLGWKEGCDGKGRPIIFESALMGEEEVVVYDRYATEEDARAGHALAVGWWRINQPLPALPAARDAGDASCSC